MSNSHPGTDEFKAILIILSETISVLDSITWNENSPEVSKLLTFEIFNKTAPILSKVMGIEARPLGVQTIQN